MDGENGIDGRNKNHSNKNRAWERPVNFEYVIPDTSGRYSDCVINQETDFEVCGGWSRHFAPSSFRLKAAKQYEGQNFMPYPFFLNDKPYIKNKAIQVRNGGNDYNCRIIDAAIHQCFIRSGFYIDCQSVQPAHVFFNGKFQYTYNVREPSNRNLSYSNYGIDKDDIDEFEISGGYVQKRGDSIAFLQWLELSQKLAESPDDDNIYKQICNLVDIDEYCNYMAAECYIGSTDWLTNGSGNNVKGFRSRSDDGRFHLVMFDVDFAFYMNNMLERLPQNLENASYSTGRNYLIDIFLNLLKHEPFKKKFIDTYCIVSGSVFEPNRCAEIINEMAKQTEKALAWEGKSPWSSANNLINKISDTNEREARIKCIRDYFGLDTTYHISLNSNINGTVLRINDIEVPTGKFDGNLFGDVIIKSAVPAGYHFKGWFSADSLKILSSSPAISIKDVATPDEHISLTAQYERLLDNNDNTRTSPPIRINEICAGNSIYINDYFKKHNWIELYNATDVELDVSGLYLSDNHANPFKYQIPESTINTKIPGHGHLVLWADKLDDISQLHTDFKIYNIDGNYVTLTSSDKFVDNNKDFFSQHPSIANFTDALIYTAHRGDQSVGRYPDGGSTYYLMHHPTIEGSNSLHSFDTAVGTDTNIDTAIKDIPASNSSEVIVGVYDVLGRFLGKRYPVTNPGMYILRFADGTSRKVLIK